MRAARFAKHAAILVLAALLAFGVGYLYAVMCMFSDENELTCTAANQHFVVFVGFLTVMALVYGLWGMARLFPVTDVRT
jgi:hypothetical protein